MLKRILSFLCLAVVCVGCGPRYIDFFPNHDDGACKPNVALVPIVDATKCKLPWNISEEMTDQLKYELRNSGVLYVASEKEVAADLNAIDKTKLFQSDVVLQTKCPQNDFVILLEMIGHDELPYNCVVDSPYALPSYPYQSILLLKMRVKIVDLRPRTPHTVLQEILTGSFIIPKKNFGDESAWVSSVQRAHQAFASQIACRLDDVIRSAY